MRCKCGKAEYWDGGISPQPCQGCTECGTTYAGSPSGHSPLEPHQYVQRYSPATGEPTHRHCSRCLQREPQTQISQSGSPQ